MAKDYLLLLMQLEVVSRSNAAPCQTNPTPWADWTNIRGSVAVRLHLLLGH